MRTIIFLIILPLFMSCVACSDDNDSSVPTNENGTIIFNNITYNVIGGGHMLEGQVRLISFSSFSDNNRQLSGNIYYNTVTNFASVSMNEISDQGVALVVSTICDPSSSEEQGLDNPNISLSTNNRISVDETFSVCTLDGAANIAGPFDLSINIPSL